MLTDNQEIIFIICMTPKFIYEISMLIIFIALLKKFNNLSEDYQQEQRGQSSFIRVAKLLAVIICLLYLINTLLFDIYTPFIWYENMHEDKVKDNHARYLLYANFGMQLADFFSCMAILYLIHQFGPYRQYLRHAELISRSSMTNPTGRTATTPSSKNTLPANQKRISGITDIQHLETLGSRMSTMSNNDPLAKRAQLIGTMSSYSVYQLSEASQF